MSIEKRIRHEREVPVSSDPDYVLELIIFKAQVSLGILVEGFCWPTVEIGGQNALGFPILTIGRINARGDGSIDLVFITDDEPDPLTL